MFAALCLIWMLMCTVLQRIQLSGIRVILLSYMHDGFHRTGSGPGVDGCNRMIEFTFSVR